MLYLPLLVLLLTTTCFAQLVPAPPAFYPSLRNRFDAYLFRTYTDPQRLAWLLVDSAMDH